MQDISDLSTTAAATACGACFFVYNEMPAKLAVLHQWCPGKDADRGITLMETNLARDAVVNTNASSIKFGLYSKDKEGTVMQQSAFR
uniref:Uncharacterized protein n=1 Tax=Romanomermis culicivorax TaxID=13658 RepID=A0A915KCN6_ROMCU